MQRLCKGIWELYLPKTTCRFWDMLSGGNGGACQHWAIKFSLSWADLQARLEFIQIWEITISIF